jgi:hypothetical protein
MRNVSHKAAATIALGLLTDDLLGALLEAPVATPANDRSRDVFAEYVAAGRWLAEIDRSDRVLRTLRRDAVFN